MNSAKTDLIRIAARLATLRLPLPANAEDHRQKTYAAKVVAVHMETLDGWLKGIAAEVRRVADRLPKEGEMNPRDELRQVDQAEDAQKET
jgi:hypothetical protein